MPRPRRRNPSKSLASLTFADIASVYSGKAGKCTCGCAGIHRYSSLVDRDAEGDRRGYPVKPNEINDAQVRKVLRILQGATGVDGFTGGFGVDIDERRYMIYLR